MEIENYQFWKLIHLVGVIIFLGNITVTAVWKILANATGEPKIIAYSQRLVTITDFIFTLVGVFLILGTGTVMAAKFGGVTATYWLASGYWIFLATAFVWVIVLIPVQVLQAKMARSFQNGGSIPQRYWMLSRIWLFAGALATILPFSVLYFMVVKP